MRYIFLLVLLLGCNSNNNEEKKNNGSDSKTLEIVAKVNKDSLMAHLTKISSYQSRHISQNGNDSSMKWIVKKLESYGYSVKLQEFTTKSSSKAYNILANKKGFSDSKEYIILDGHYDSTSSKNETDNKHAPGASDNGSGVAILIEAARILKDYDYNKQLRYIFFDAEETGLEGSNYYSSDAKSKNHKIEFLFNIDMVGGQKDYQSRYNAAQKIVCEEDRNNSPSENNQASKNLNAELVLAMKAHTNLQTKIDLAYSSDYEGFQKEGYTIIGLYEDHGQESLHYHKTTDLIENMNPEYLFQVAKGTIGFLAKKLDITNTAN